MPLIDKVWYELELRDADFVTGMKRDAQTWQQFDQGAAKVNTTVGGLQNGIRAASRAVAENTVTTVAGTRGMSAWSAMHAEAAGHVGAHSLGLSRLERALEEFSAHAIGANRVLALLATTMTRFAVGSIETAGILGGIALVVGIYEHMTAAAREAKKAQEELITSLEKGNFQAALGPEPDLVLQTNAQRNLLRQQQSRRRTLLAFGVSPEDTRILDLNRDIANSQRELEEGEKRLFKARMDAGKPLDTVVTKARDLTAEMEKQKTAVEAFKAAIAAQSPGAQDNFAVEIDRLVDAAKKAHVGATEIQKLVGELQTAHAAALAKEGADLADTMRTELAKASGLQAASLKEALDQFDAQIRGKIVAGVPVDLQLVAQLRAAKIEAIALAGATDELSRHLIEIEHNSQQGFGFIQSMRTLIDDLDRANADFASAKARGDVAGMTAAQQRINTILAAQKKLQDDIAAIIAKQNDETTSLTQKLASGVAGLADVAFGLVSAFAGANSELTKMIGGISQAAHGVDTLMTLANTKNANGVAPGLGGLLTTGAGLLSAAPAIGQIIGGGIALASSLFGKSPEETARLQALKENNARLRELTAKVGDLAKINVTGTDLGKFTALLADPRFANVRGQAGSDIQNRDIGAILQAFGITAAELKAFAQQFGIAVGTGAGGKITIDDINKLRDAIKNSELSQFADDFTGQMQRMDAEIRIFSLSKPIQQFEEFRKVLNSINKGPGALAGLLQGIDLTTSAGLDAARKAVQDLFDQFQSLSGDALASFLGGLTPEDFVNAIERLTDLINAQASGGGVAGTGGFNVDRTITEVTGSRMAALLSTANSFAERTAFATETIASILGGGAIPTINAPTVAAGAQAVGTSLVIQNLTIAVGAGADSQATGAAVGESFIDTIDRQLGGKVKWARRAQGLAS